jgi:hypothetical protein
MSHDHRDNCPPKLDRTIWWVAPALIFVVPVVAGLLWVEAVENRARSAAAGLARKARPSERRP